jgi:hypothetical protein
MRNTKLALRKAVYDLLKDQIVIDEVTIPVFDEKRQAGVGSGNLFIVLSTQQESESTWQTDCNFCNRSSIDIEIMVKTAYEVTKDTQDDVEQQILDILFPSYGGDVLQDAVPGLCIQNLRRERSLTRNLTLSNSESVMQTIITVVADITEQS